MNDRTLFDVDRTTTAVCQVPGCNALREPTWEWAPACAADAERSSGDYAPRPRDCLNAYDPAHAPFPEGF